MKMLRNFKCLNDHITEKFAKQDELLTECKECNEVATRMLSAPRCFGNTTGGSPSTNYSKPR
jgi:translation initiation factor 2 beta subunit (eIF-2beta)/eIF-5